MFQNPVFSNSLNGRRCLQIKCTWEFVQCPTQNPLIKYCQLLNLFCFGDWMVTARWAGMLVILPQVFLLLWLENMARSHAARSHNIKNAQILVEWKFVLRSRSLSKLLFINCRRQQYASAVFSLLETRRKEKEKMRHWRKRRSTVNSSGQLLAPASMTPNNINIWNSNATFKLLVWQHFWFSAEMRNGNRVQDNTQTICNHWKKNLLFHHGQRQHYAKTHTELRQLSTEINLACKEDRVKGPIALTALPLNFHSPVPESRL